MSIIALTIIAILAVIGLAAYLGRGPDASRCHNGGKRHQFEARYSEASKPIPGFKMAATPWMTDEAVIELAKCGTMRTATYEGDVCIWCGKVVNVPAPAAAAPVETP